MESDDLVALNVRIGEMEQAGGSDARTFFESLLGDRFVFRRASGKIVGKSGPEGYLEGLANNPFSFRHYENISVSPLDDRALVTLIVVGTRADDGSVHRYRNIRLFTRTADKWMLEFWYNYEITGS